jgi:hypothetical protein
MADVTIHAHTATFASVAYLSIFDASASIFGLTPETVKEQIVTAGQLPEQVELRQIKYPNNLIEQDPFMTLPMTFS